jgi:hypothetical protein
MSATVLMIILIGGGAIVFYVRFLIALHKESRSQKIGRVTVRSGVRMGGTLEHRIPYRQSSAIVRLVYRIDGYRGHQGRFVYDGEVRPDVVCLIPTQNRLNLGVIRTFDCNVRH